MRDIKGKFKSRGRLLKRNCERCGKQFEFYSSRLKRGGGKFCSISCSMFGTQRARGHEVSKEHRKKLVNNWGKREKHWNWKGGVTEQNTILRQSLQYIIWRNEVYRRDRWTCRICKIHCQRKNIVAHHIKLFSEFPELRFSIDNGIVLCRKCHAQLHRPGDNNKRIEY